MSSLSIVNRPTMGRVTEGLLQIINVRTGDAYFKQLTFIDEDLKVISSTLYESFRSKNSFKPTTLFWCTSQTFFIKYQPNRTAWLIPRKQWCIKSLRTVNDVVRILFHELMFSNKWNLGGCFEAFLKIYNVNLLNKVIYLV